MNAPTTPDPIEIAMAAEAAGAPASGEAALLLREQRRLIGWEIADKRAALGLKVGTGLVGLAVVAVLGWMAWSASRADGLVIRPLSVPPALAARGVTGEALAAQLMDRLGAMSERSSEAQRQVSATQADGVSIQIPETGISLSQLDQWLKQKLGHERRLTGEVAVAPDGRLVLTARDGAIALPEQRGTEAELPAMLQRAAEALLQREQPITYSLYLSRAGRVEDYKAHGRWMIAHGDRPLKALGYANLGNRAETVADSERFYRRAQAVDPLATSASYLNLAVLLRDMGRSEEAYGELRRLEPLFGNRKAFPTLTPAARRQRLNDASYELATLRHDTAAAVALDRAFAAETLVGYGAGATGETAVAISLAATHDMDAARRQLATFVPENPEQLDTLLIAKINVAGSAEDWPEVLRLAPERKPAPREAQLPVSDVLIPIDLARVRSGRVDEAERRIAATPLSCAPCVMLRGAIAAARGQPALADHWLREASRMTPSLPEAPYRWGRILLARGDAGGAARQFQEAARRGPLWAEPLVGGGEALLAGGDAAGAVTKFEAAEKLAPKWGRLHLKWGQALAKLGKADEAKAEWRTAAGLYLTPMERAELAKQARP